MDKYNVLVLMQKDTETGFLTETIESYTISEDMEYIKSAYLLEETEGHFVFLSLTTKDVEDWEYYGIYELYDESIFDNMAVEVLDDADDYNPSWILKIKYDDNKFEMEDKLNCILRQHIVELDRIAPVLIENKERFTKEMNEIETEE